MKDCFESERYNAEVDQLVRATARAEARHFWFQGFRRFVVPLLRRATHGLEHARILDCGCGTGANLELLGQFGRASGFDLSALALRIGRESGRRSLARATVAAAPFADASFDVVVSFDVLYSLPDSVERTAVAEMYRLLRPGGFAIVNAAAMEMLRGDHSILGHEVRRYSRKSLGALLTGAGFTIVRVTYTNASLFLPMAVARAAQRWRGLASEADAESDIKVPPEPLNTVLAGVLRAESLWLRRFDLPFGSSLLCLARKSA
jgi:SAM-dependent methyltransferase